MVELIDMFMPTSFNITLIAAIYVMHRSFHAVDPLGFVTGGIIALTSNFYMTKHLHVNPIFALIITVFLFPVFQFLWAAGMKKMHVKEPTPDWHIPHHHMPHPHEQQQQNQQNLLHPPKR